MSRTAKLFTGLTLLAPFLLAFSEPTFIGSGKCKICHKVEYASWEKLGHARAFERLTAADQGKAECLQCHATGGDKQLPGVQCEACHGPGSGYKSLKVMKDPAASKAAGLIHPGEAQCRECHTKAPHELPAFDYATAKKKGIHDMKNPR